MTGNVKVHMPTLGKLAEVFEPQRFDRVIGQAATRAVAMLQQVTPQGFFHQMIKSWNIQDGLVGSRTIINTYQTTSARGNRYWIADLVEYGTKNEGSGFIEPIPPKTRLFIPLNAKAAMAYSRGARRKLKYGVDYVLARRVRGIKPRWFVRDRTPAINDMVKDRLVAFLRDELAKRGLGR